MATELNPHADRSSTLLFGRYGPDARSADLEFLPTLPARGAPGGGELRRRQCLEAKQSVSVSSRVKLALRIWRSYLRVRRSVKTTPLAGLTRQLGAARATEQHHPPELLGYAVGRSLAWAVARPAA